jgi:hypothetical protein
MASNTSTSVSLPSRSSLRLIFLACVDLGSFSTGRTVVLDGDRLNGVRSCDIILGSINGVSVPDASSASES